MEYLALVLFVFDKEKGHIVKAMAVTEHVNPEDLFCYDFTMPKVSALHGKTLSMKIEGKKRLYAHPVYIEDPYYHRQSFYFSICMVAWANFTTCKGSVRTFEMLASEFARLERQTRLISATTYEAPTYVNGDITRNLMRSILKTMLHQLNSGDKVWIEIISRLPPQGFELCHLISFLKVSVPNEPLTFQDFSKIPVPLRDLARVFGKEPHRYPMTLDKSVSEIAAYLDGKRSIQQIAHISGLPDEVVNRITNKMAEVGWVRMIETIDPHHRYTHTDLLETSQEDDILKSWYKKLMGFQRTFAEFCDDYAESGLTQKAEDFLGYGLWQGFVRRIWQFPAILKTGISEDEPVFLNAVVLGLGTKHNFFSPTHLWEEFSGCSIHMAAVKRLIKLCDGSREIEEVGTSAHVPVSSIFMFYQTCERVMHSREIKSYQANLYLL